MFFCINSLAQLLLVDELYRQRRGPVQLRHVKLYGHPIRRLVIIGSLINCVTHFVIPRDIFEGH